MRIDAYTHFFPKKFFDKMLELAGDHKDMGKRVRAIPALYDLDHRMKIVDSFPDYAQILSYPQPPLEVIAKGKEIDELSRIINDGFAELCARPSAPSRSWARSGCRSTPTWLARRSTAPNTRRSGPR